MRAEQQAKILIFQFFLIKLIFIELPNFLTSQRGRGLFLQILRSLCDLTLVNLIFAGFWIPMYFAEHIAHYCIERDTYRAKQPLNGPFFVPKL